MCRSVHRFVPLIVAAAAALAALWPASASAQPPAPVPLGEGWEFQATKGGPWKPVSVPHVFDGQADPEVFDGQVSWYRLRFDTPETEDGYGWALRFDAVRRRAAVYLNGQRVASGDNWQTPARVDIRRRLRPGANELLVEGANSGGPAGLAVKLVLTPRSGHPEYVVSDESWSVSERRDAPGSQSAITRGKMGDQPWGDVFAAAPAGALPQSPRDVFQTLPDQVERHAAREMARVLKPGGAGVLNFAALELLRGGHSVLAEEVRRYRPGQVRALLEGAGLVVERLTFAYAAVFPLMLAARVGHRWRRPGREAEAEEWEITVPPAPVNSALTLALGVEAVALRAINMPFGSSLICLVRKPR